MFVGPYAEFRREAVCGHPALDRVPVLRGSSLMLRGREPGTRPPFHTSERITSIETDCQLPHTDVT